MNIKYILAIVIGIFIGWCTIPFASAKEDNTYKGLLREAITVLEHIQTNTAQTAENTKAIKEKLGAK